MRSNRWRESQNRLAEFGLHGNTALLPLARLDTAIGGDDEAVRNGDDDGESVADLELFRQLVAIPPKKCLRPACRVGVTVRCRHVKTARTKLERSAAAAVIGGMELMPCRTAQRVKSMQPMEV